MERISIIIPTLNEAETIGQTLDRLTRMAGEECEVIVSDGGSTDETPNMAKGRARLIEAPRGRARQMNAGAQTATGDILLFLHSDTTLPEGGPNEIRRLLHDPKTVGGGFSIRFDDPAISFRLLEWGSNLRARTLGLIFGDQAIFVRREVFAKAGGFREMELMEDWDISRRLRREGRVVLSPLRVTTSPRRFRKQGVWRTFRRMQVIKILYVLGVSPNRLSRLYEKEP